MLYIYCNIVKKKKKKEDISGFTLGTLFLGTVTLNILFFNLTS